VALERRARRRVDVQVVVRRAEGPPVLARVAALPDHGRHERLAPERAVEQHAQRRLPAVVAVHPEAAVGAQQPPRGEQPRLHRRQPRPLVQRVVEVGEALPRVERRVDVSEPDAALQARHHVEAVAVEEQVARHGPGR
jgi:hypothetical protein